MSDKEQFNPLPLGAIILTSRLFWAYSISLLVIGFVFGAVFFSH